MGLAVLELSRDGVALVRAILGHSEGALALQHFHVSVHCSLARVGGGASPWVNGYLISNHALETQATSPSKAGCNIRVRGYGSILECFMKLEFIPCLCSAR